MPKLSSAMAMMQKNVNPFRERPISVPSLGDFTTDARVLMLIGMALVVGTTGAAAAWALLRVRRLLPRL